MPGMYGRRAPLVLSGRSLIALAGSSSPEITSSRTDGGTPGRVRRVPACAGRGRRSGWARKRANLFETGAYSLSGLLRLLDANDRNQARPPAQGGKAAEGHFIESAQARKPMMEPEPPLDHAEKLKFPKPVA